MKKEVGRRKLDTLPKDKEFIVEMTEHYCKATGYEVCFSDPSDPSKWWKEYVDANDDLHYAK